MRILGMADALHEVWREALYWLCSCSHHCWFSATSIFRARLSNQVSGPYLVASVCVEDKVLEALQKAESWGLM